MNLKEAAAMADMIEDKARDLAERAQRAMAHGDKDRAQFLARAAATSAHNAQRIREVIPA